MPWIVLQWISQKKTQCEIHWNHFNRFFGMGGGSGQPPFRIIASRWSVHHWFSPGNYGSPFHFTLIAWQRCTSPRHLRGTCGWNLLSSICIDWSIDSRFSYRARGGICSSGLYLGERFAFWSAHARRKQWYASPTYPSLWIDWPATIVVLLNPVVDLHS